MLVLTHFWQRGSSSQLDRRSEKLKALVYLTAEGSLVWAPPGAHTSCIAFKCMHGQPIPLIQDKQTTGTSLSTFMESTILVMVCVCNSRARVCLWLVPMDRAEIRQQEEERSIKRFKSEESKWVSFRKWGFWNPLSRRVGAVPSDSSVLLFVSSTN